MLFKILLERGVSPVIVRLLFNMYTHSTMKVKWNNSCFDSLLNGTRQGSVISPTLFTVYIDGLLQKLKRAGIGCFVGRTYAGAFGYADDLALLAPSLSSLRKMICICEKYAEEFSILFNPGKSKLLCYNLPTDSVPCIKLCGEVVEIVSNEKHLGNKLFNNIYKRDMSEFVGNFYKSSNSVIANFSMCDSFTLNNLHSSFCSSLYGVELFNLNKSYMSDLYTAHRKGLFRIPARTHNSIVIKLAGDLVSKLDCRIAKFIFNMVNHDNDTVRYHSKQTL